MDATKSLESPVVQSNPWHFLSPLNGSSSQDRALIEMTRGHELSVVEDMVVASNVSLLYSFSGNGKTSLIEAGILPRFRDMGFLVFKTRPRPPWQLGDPTLAFKEGILKELAAPTLTIAEVEDLRAEKLQLEEARLKLEETKLQLDKMVPEAATEVVRALETLEKITRLVGLQAGRPPEIVAKLREALASPLAEFLGKTRSLLDSDQRMLIVCDQFEELFVHYGNTPEMSDLIEQLGEVWSNQSLMVHLLFSMREEWVGSMVEFRQSIPDIFSNYFKLDPLRRSAAYEAFTKLLTQHGEEFEPQAIGQLLDDLARSYSVNQRDRSLEVKLERSPKDDPFIELPALQVVAHRLWQSKDQQERPFSLGHYESLMTRKKTEEGEPEIKLSPAEWVLDHYLEETLEKLEVRADDLSVHERKELILDGLYLLTDKNRHRRALTGSALVEEIGRIRPVGLGLPAVAAERLADVLRPMVDQRFLLEHEGEGGEKQYELAHDFAVRSVVKSWREVDRKRIAAKAVYEERVSSLERRDARALRFLRVAPLLGFTMYVVILTAIVNTLNTYGPRPSDLEVREFGTFFSTVAVAIFSTMLGVGLINRHFLGSILGGVALFASFSIPFVLSPYTPVFYRVGAPNLVEIGDVMVGNIENGSDTDYYMFAIQTPTAVFIELHSEMDSAYLSLLNEGLTVLSSVSSGKITRSLPAGIYYVDLHGDGGNYSLGFGVDGGSASSSSDVVRKVEEREPNDWIDKNIYSWEVGKRLRDPVVDLSFGGFFVTIGAGLLLIMIFVNAAAISRELQESRLRRQILSTLSAECIDAVVMLIMGAVFFWLFFVPSGEGTAFGFACVIVLFGMSFFVRRVSATPGEWVNRLEVTFGSGGIPASFGRILFRQTLYPLFIAPSLFLGPLVIWKSKGHRTIYDILSGSRLVERGDSLKRARGEPGAAVPPNGA